MNNLVLISFVGVDEKTNFDDIEYFESKYPCEWSVLYSDSKSVGNYVRYPSYDFCDKFLKWGKSRGWLTSLHLCGSSIERYLKQDKDIIDLCSNAYRIQLNFNIQSFPSYEKLASDLIDMMTNHNHSIILQQNKTKSNFNLCFLKTISSSLYGNINILYDGSGGFGREISEVHPPNSRHFTGYAGGIKPENVAKIVDLIEKNNPNQQKYYIDMESGVRTDNIFSIEKCRQVVENLI